MIAVFGGRGFIGRHVVSRLRAAGRDVVVVTHDDAAAAAPSVRHGDVRRPETLAHALSDVDTVVHAANFPSYPVENRRRGFTYSAFDERATCDLVSAASRAGVRRFLFVAGVGADPQSPKPYFRAIGRGEERVLSSNLRGASLRPTLVYGPGDRGLNRLLANARRFGVVLLLGDGRQLHQPVFVEDVAEAAERWLSSDTIGVIEVGGPERMPADELVERALRVAGIRARIVHLPVRPVRWGGWLLEQLPEPPLTVAAIDFLLEDFVTQSVDASDRLRTPFEAALRRYLAP